MEDNKNQEVNLLDYLAIIIEQRKKIFRNVFVTVLLIAAVSLILPGYYTARTTVLPPEDTNSNGLLTALSNTPLSNILLAESGTTSDLFVEILKSRSVLDGVLQEHFKYPRGKKNAVSKSLKDILRVKSLEKGRKKLLKNVDIQASKEGIIRIDVELKNPELAADVANSFVVQLDKINKLKSTSRAKNSRLYIENQLQLTEEKLGTASKELVAFQEQNKAVSLEEQTEAAIKEAGELKGNIIAKEVELGVALQSLKPDHISIIKLRKELEELNKQYNYLQYGDDNNPEKQKEFYIPFSNVPEIGLELARLTRNVKVQETVWELLNQQYYHAKIQEARDTPTIEVLDIAVVPETRSKPKRKLLVLVGGFLAIMFNIFWVFAKDFYEKLKSDPTSSHKTNNIVNSLKSDFFSGKNFFTNIQNRFKRNKNQH
ncbi:hypothetical protein B6I21_00500 [candidate division KSB1 bacterium 4572_119]|nr:MAG: hypothetical protein B6I21_00500 [candidate division KSB1 bacterium 4572_119]